MTAEVLAAVFLILSCSSYVIPYLDLNVENTYSSSTVKIYYTYVCEGEAQTCSYALYNKNDYSSAYLGYEYYGELPESDFLLFEGLAEGDYQLDFTVYTEKNGEYTALKFLDESYTFTVDIP